MPPSRIWLEIIFCVSEDLQEIDHCSLIHKVTCLPLLMNEEPQKNQLCHLYLMSQNDDLIVEQFVKKALTSYYNNLQNEMMNLFIRKSLRKQISKIKGLKLPLFCQNQLSPNHVLRQKEIEKIIDKFRKMNSSHGMVLLYGMGGAGKTSLCHEILQNEIAEEFFSGGVLMLTIGLKVDKSLHQSNLHKIYKHLRSLTPLDKMINGTRTSEEEINSPVYDYPTAIRTITSNLFMPKVLIIIDDVWNGEEIKPYDQLGLLCLVTSRKSFVLNNLRDKVVKISMPSGFTQNHSEQFWAKQFGDMKPFSVEFTRITKYLSILCQFSPLALSCIASSIVQKSHKQSIIQRLLQIFLVMKAKLSGILSRKQIKSYSYEPVIECIKMSVTSIKEINVKLFSDKYSIKEKFNYLVLFDETTIISEQLLMILWEMNSTEAAKMDLELFHRHSLILKKQNKSFILHSLHVEYLRDKNWTQIQQYLQECIYKLRSFCCGKWFLIDNQDGNLWKILFHCCKVVYKQTNLFPNGLVTDLRVWNAYGRARGLVNLYNEMQHCIRLSSLTEKEQMKQFLNFIQQLPNENDSLHNYNGPTFEFIQHAIFSPGMISLLNDDVLQSIQTQNEINSFESFYWTHNIGSYEIAEKNIIYQWKCRNYCVDYKNFIVYAISYNNKILRMTRKEIKHLKFELMKKTKDVGMYKIHLLQFNNLIAIEINWHNGPNEWKIFYLNSFNSYSCVLFVTFYCKSMFSAENVKMIFSPSTGISKILLKSHHYRDSLIIHELFLLNLKSNRRSYGRSRKIFELIENANSFKWTSEVIALDKRFVFIQYCCHGTTCLYKLKRFDLFIYEFDSELVICADETMPIYLYHWKNQSIKTSSTLEIQRIAVIKSSGIKVYDGYLELIEEIPSLFPIPVDKQIQIFMQRMEKPMKRIKVYNLNKTRYEIHYSTLWHGPTNALLYGETRLFGNEPTCNYFFSKMYDSSVKEFCRKSNTIIDSIGKIKTIMGQNKCFINRVKRVFTCEIIQDSNGKDYIQILATSSKVEWKCLSKFNNLQIFVFSCSESLIELLSIVFSHQENIIGRKAGISNGWMWTLDWNYLNEDGSVSVKNTSKTADYIINVAQLKFTNKNTIEQILWKSFPLAWESEKIDESIFLLYWKPFFCEHYDNNQKEVTMFLCHPDGKIDLIRLSAKKKVKLYELHSGESGAHLWRISERIIMAIVIPDKADDNRKYDDHIVSCFLPTKTNGKWIISNVYRDKYYTDKSSVFSCSCNKIFAVLLPNEAKEVGKLIISTFDRQLIFDMPFTNCVFCDLLFYHLEDTCILAVKITDTENGTLRVIFISREIAKPNKWLLFFSGKSNRVYEVKLSNSINLKQRSEINFSLCGKYLLVNDHLTFITYAVSLQQHCLEIVNQFTTSKKKQIAVLLNNNTVVPHIERNYCSIL